MQTTKYTFRILFKEGKDNICKYSGLHGKDTPGETDLGIRFHLQHELMIQKEVLYHWVCLNCSSMPLANWLLSTHFVYEDYVTNKAQIRNDLSIL